MPNVELVDGHQMIDRRLKRTKNFLVSLIAVEINNHLRHGRDQPPEHLALHRREIKETVEYQQINSAEPRQVNFSPLEFAT